jgi:hypothetical protein
MMVTLLRNDCNMQESLFSESVVAIRINFKPCKVTTSQHYTRKAMKTPRLPTVRDDYQRVGSYLGMGSNYFQILNSHSLYEINL